MKKTFSAVKHAIPWALAALIFYFLFKEYPPSKTVEAAKYMNLLYFISYAVFYFLFMYFIDCYTIQRVVGIFDKAVDLKDIMIGRAATYLVMIINYPAGQGAFAYYLKKRHQIPIMESLSIFFFIMFIDFLWLASFGLIGSFFHDFSVVGVDLGHIVRVAVVTVYIGFFLWIGFWSNWFDSIFRIRLLKRCFDWVRNKPSFRIFKRAKILDYAKVALMRLPVHVFIIVSMYIIIQTFGVHIEFSKILGNIPIVMFVGSLPVTPGGLGTTNAVMIELLEKFVTGGAVAAGLVSASEILLAFSLLWMFANYMMKGIFGLIFLHKVSRDIFKAKEEELVENA